MGAAGTPLDGRRSKGAPAFPVAETLALGGIFPDLRMNKQQKREGRREGGQETMHGYYSVEMQNDLCVCTKLCLTQRVKHETGCQPVLISLGHIGEEKLSWAMY